MQVLTTEQIQEMRKEYEEWSDYVLFSARKVKPDIFALIDEILLLRTENRGLVLMSIRERKAAYRFQRALETAQSALQVLYSTDQDFISKERLIGIIEYLSLTLAHQRLIEATDSSAPRAICRAALKESE